jgi:hypothetical protein
MLTIQWQMGEKAVLGEVIRGSVNSFLLEKITTVLS